jgi:hypothetical protein
MTSAGDCDQVPPPIGPYTAGSPSARISRISPDGRQRTSVIERLPSSQSSAKSGGTVSGVADIAFVEDTLYALVSGAGCSHGLKDTANGVFRVNADGTPTLVANLSAFWKTHPVENPDLNDLEPDGTPYSMASVDGKLYVLDPHNGELDEITTDGRIRRLIDISKSEGHIVPTSLVFHRDSFFVGNLHRFPVQVGSSRIYQIGLDGSIRALAPQLTAVLGITFDTLGNLYALETTTVNASNPVPGSGRVVRVQPQSESTQIIASGLNLPTAMTIGPDGMLYVSDFGFGFAPGMGQIIRISPPNRM